MTGSSGNGCGHDRENPRLDPLELSSERLPVVLFDIQAATENVFYQRHHEAFADIGEARRSEICEAMVLVLKAEVARMDIVTKRIGRPRNDGSVVGIPADRLAEITGLNISRLNRALRELHDAGWMTSCQPCELKSDGTYRGYPAIRTLTPRLFRVLRVNLKLDAAAKKESIARKERAQARQAAAGAAASARLARQVHRMNKKMDSRRLDRPIPQRTRDEAERNLRLNTLMVDLRSKHPEWPPEQIRAAARELLDRYTGP